MGGVQPEHHERHATGKHDLRGVWVAQGVELGGRGPVAHVQAAAHPDDLLYERRDVGGKPQSQSQVGERSGGQQRDKVGPRPYLLDDEQRGVQRFRLMDGAGQQRPVQPGLSVHALGRQARHEQRAVCPGVHGRRGTDQCQRHQGVAGGALQAHVAVGGAHSQDF